MAIETILIGVAISLISAGVNYYVSARRAEQALRDNAPSEQEIRFPQVTASAPIPVVFGTRRMAGPNVVWFGDSGSIQRHDRDDRNTGVRRYHANLAMVFCQGPIDSVQRIIVGDVVADDTIRALPGMTQFTMSQGTLFGSAAGEGGLIGYVRLNPGRPNQARDIFLDTRVRGDGDTNILPALRGVFSIILEGVPGEAGAGLGGVQSFYHGTQPQIKPWAVEVRRTQIRSFADPQWNAAKAAIDGDMNPAHIIHELLTDDQWGLGLHTDFIDDVSFTAAALLFETENLGLSFAWWQDTSVLDFIREVSRHVDALCYVNPFTNKWELRPVRDDYDVDTIPALTPAEVIEIASLTRPSVDELVTMVSVVYRDRALDRDEIAYAHDTAGVIERGEIQATMSYPGASRPAVANRLAQRDLRQMSVPRASIELTVHESAAQTLLPGDVFNLAWPDYGITRITLRLINIDWGTPTSGAVTMQCVEDGFAYDAALYAAPVPTRFVDPVTAPQNAAGIALEMPLYLRSVEEGVNWQESSSFWATYAATATCRAVFAAVKPTFQHGTYDAHVNTAGHEPFFLERRTDWSRTVDHKSSVSYSETATVIEVEPGSYATPGELLYAPVSDAEPSGEILRVVSFDSDLLEMTVERGLFDTTPRVIKSTVFYSIGTLRRLGTALDTIEAAYVVDLIRDTDLSSPREVEFRALTATGAGQLTYAAATPRTQDLRRRLIRPYPPGNTTVVQETLPRRVEVRWAHRNRLTHPFPLQTDGDQGPEASVRYELRIYEESPTPALLRTIDTHLTEYDYTTVFEDGDRFDAHGGSGEATRLRFEIDSYRGTKGVDDVFCYHSQIRELSSR